MDPDIKQIEVKPGIVIDLAEIKRFVRKAKKATYASGGGLVPENWVQIPGNTEHEYQTVMRSGTRLYYRDSYCGYLTAPGREIVRLGGKDGLAVWSMSYDGGMVKPYETLGEQNLSVAGKVFSFLKGALSKVPKDLPLRGPWIYETAQYPGLTYQCHIFAQDFGQFSGEELIISECNRIFHQRFSGGIIVHR